MHAKNKEYSYINGKLYYELVKTLNKYLSTLSY